MSIAKTVRRLQDQELHTSTVELAQLKREATEKILWHLKEIERRKLYIKYSARSLHGYCTKHLKYSQSAAGRSVQVARLLHDNPEISETLRSGEVNLSTLCIADLFLRSEEARTGQKFAPRTKALFFHEIRNKTKEEVERLMVDAFPQVRAAKSGRRQLKDGRVEYRFVLSKEESANYDRVRETNSHKPRFLEMAGLFASLLEENLRRTAPEWKRPKLSAAESSEPGVRGYVSVEQMRQLHERAGSQCQQMQPDGTRCESRYHLQVDHIVPLARGGRSELINYQLLCAPHNAAKGTWISLETYSLKAMSRQQSRN